MELYVMDADGSNVRRLSQPGPGLQVNELGLSVNFPQLSGSPAWSPDGEALYYHRVGAEGPEVRRITLDGSADIRVLANGLTPAVRPDGRMVFLAHTQATIRSPSPEAATSSR